ncbi:MAG: GntR family transcriptional regulator, partial [Clostridia bacterium]|nr:GntR family transcriptional regulator [Clostridia bacterium]
LCVQLKNLLIDEIREGGLEAGKRLPGERIMADKHGVSRGTAAEALRLLKEDGYIERIPTKGNFIVDNIGERISTVNILFPFPEISMSRDIIDFSNWVSDTEIHRGLLEGAAKYNASVNFHHFEVSKEPSVIIGQMRKIRSFDAVFFISKQYPALMEAMDAEDIPYIVCDTSGSYSHSMTISYRMKQAVRDCADYLISCGYKSIGLLMSETRCQSGDLKISYFRERMSEKSLSIDEKSIYRISDNEEKAFEQLLQMLPRSSDKLPEVFFCETMTAPLSFLRAAHARHWQIGKDIDIMGYAGETAMRNTVPQITYLKIPYVEIGRESCRLLHEKVTKKHNEIIHHEVPAHIVEGNSTRKMK